MKRQELLHYMLEKKFSLGQILRISIPMDGKSDSKKEEIATRLLEEVKNIEPEPDDEDEEAEEEEI